MVTHFVRRIHCSGCKLHWLDARDKDHEKKMSELTVRQGSLFDEAAKKARNKETFKAALQLYIKRHGVYRRGHVEFMYAALERMREFQVHRDIEAYKALIDIFPKEKMVPRSIWQVEMMHYPKQQQCCIDILDEMEYNGKRLLYGGPPSFQTVA